jgi:hypothetical protein
VFLACISAFYFLIQFDLLRTRRSGGLEPKKFLFPASWLSPASMLFEPLASFFLALAANDGKPADLNVVSSAISKVLCFKSLSSALINYISHYYYCLIFSPLLDHYISHCQVILPTSSDLKLESELEPDSYLAMTSIQERPFVSDNVVDILMGRSVLDVVPQWRVISILPLQLAYIQRQPTEIHKWAALVSDGVTVKNLKLVNA